MFNSNYHHLMSYGDNMTQKLGF